MRERARVFILTLTQNRLHVVDSVVDRAVELASFINSDQSRFRTRTLNPIQVLELTRTLAESTSLEVGIDYGLSYIWLYATLFGSKKLDYTNEYWQPVFKNISRLVNGVVTLAREAGRGQLVYKLLKQSIPLPNASGQDWLQYADELLAILQNERELGHEWYLSGKEGDKLASYFYANEVLVQCLKVAVVSDRQAVFKDLMVPPQVG
jgi:hypothetical protein